ncbi:MAG TPA: hypothetical protein VF412_17380 [Bdellovibrio sp.]|uniref:hypothetical protein n=1 Tax=Bdellovibrio sp. TaxID=28201 RepID=UPI002EE78FE7
MKKYFYILAALSMAPTFALAQSIENDVDAELDQMYSGQKAAAANTQTANVNAMQAAQGAQQAPQQAQPLNLNGSQPIYILNQAPSTASAQVQQQSQVQKQPTTVIEATPLTESRAEQIRKSRQDAEVQTEQRIVEKLEQSRMEDEKKRANVLFGDKFNQLNNQQEQQPVQVQQVQQVQAPVQQVPVQQVQEPKENTRDIIREELAAARKDEEAAAQAPIENKYVSIMAGVADLPDVRNVKGNYSLGVSFGNKYDNFIVEGTFLYSNYTVDQGGGYVSNYSYLSPYGGTVYIPNNVDVNQYSGQIAAKLQLFSGIIRPVVGALASYSYRTFAWSNNNSGYAYNNDSTANSSAIDLGALAGVDLELSPKYALGLDFRYMWNMSSRVDSSSNTWMNTPAYGTPIEKLQYYVMSVSGRFYF